MSNYRVVMLTCDHYLECLKPFGWLFNKYWSSEQQVVVGGYTPPNFELPPNFQFISIGRYEDQSPRRYSNGLIKFLHQLRDDVFVWMLEDQWLHGQVNLDEIQTCVDVARQTKNLLRIDLIEDRKYMNEFTFGAAEPYGTFNGVELIKSRWCPYQFAIYGTIFNRQKMLQYLRPNLDPWLLETETNKLLEHEGERAVVLGTTRKLIQCANGLRQQKAEYDAGKRGITAAAIEGGIKDEDLVELKALGLYDEAKLLRFKR